MKAKVPKMCITCKHYEPYHCLWADDYIGFLDCDEPVNCKAYGLHPDYKRGGRFYDDRPDIITGGAEDGK